MSKTGPETQLVNAMRKAGKEKYGRRLVTIKYHGGPHSEAGVSDLLCVLDGMFIAVEVKHPKNYSGSVEKALLRGPTLKQTAFLQRVADAGGTAAACANVEQFMEVLHNATSHAEYHTEETGYRRF